MYPNWFTVYADAYFERHLTDLAGKPGLRFLQIGAFTGDASVWMLDNVLTGPGSVLVDVDTWEGSDEAVHVSFDWRDVEETYDQRMVGWRIAGKVRKHKCPSSVYLALSLVGLDDAVLTGFDFIYIDGEHTAPAVLEDAVGAFRILKPDGLLAFDDYLWESGKGDRNNPALAINAVRAVYRDQLQLLDLGQQVWFRKR